MPRALFLAWLVLLGASAAHGQALGVLQIKVVVMDAERNATPVARHVLLVSDNPPSAPPRAITTARDGTFTVRLRPGNYTVESEKPVAFQGRTYEWTQRVDIAAGRDTVLELTAANAHVETPTSPLETDASFLLPQWQGSVVALWTPTAHASGFVIDAKGLIATNQRVVGTATAVEVQITPQMKVMARVLAADPVRDVAILWIDPAVGASLRPVPLGCAQAARPPVAVGQEFFTIGTPLRGEKGITSGPVGRIERRYIVADFRLAPGSAGGPVFTAAGDVVGITSVSPDEDSQPWASRVVRIEEACEVVGAAHTKMQGAAHPEATRLPVEPARTFPVDALKEAAKARAGSLSPPRMSSSDFDIAFITPVLTYGAQSTPSAGTASDVLRPIRDFSNWSDYVAEYPPVLLIRVTPKQVEGLWTKVARGAAMTQGVALPPMRRAKAGFSRMRAFCGDAEVLPIHPFTLEQRVSETEAIYEGLYVFDPDALGPQCAAVKLALYSEKAPDKGDTRTVDPSVIQRTWQDFAPYRAAGAVAR
jgi:S1-C subfamily serine protease